MTATATEVTSTAATLDQIAADRGVTFENVRVLDGMGRQIIDVYKDGKLARRLSHRGTVDQAKAKALAGYTHDTDPQWAPLVAIVRGA
ncbi:hypothetical protein Sme01_03560 [Sphaerisporangium melleum]|uniref:Uncharacterized protein n=1 Tax=Sphaerisporangium melleum TaxID=321316 RepID=A0A917QPF0_9ACTN|nr:hypothetical protein [Sphaerisporangium melleum]GGK61706.1 hypothetical protein GCM10007964_01110 [Sphaerisporangium melleum]GII67880.1 hypothetical protein Sme01_03560 [Sphaerisporangium melleum]